MALPCRSGGREDGLGLQGGQFLGHPLAELGGGGAGALGQSLHEVRLVHGTQGLGVGGGVGIGDAGDGLILPDEEVQVG